MITMVRTIPAEGGVSACWWVEDGALIICLAEDLTELERKRYERQARFEHGLSP